MKTKFKDISNQFIEARNRLAQIIKSLPDSSDDIRILPGHTNCGVVSFSKIGSNGGRLDAQYYITMETKKTLLRIIESNRSVDTITNFIENVLATGTLKDKGYTSTIAPIVLSALKKAWEE
jgi:hypothetical protein